MKTLKSTRQQREITYKAKPQSESAQHDEAHPDHWGMVKVMVVLHLALPESARINPYLTKNIRQNDSGIKIVFFY